MKAKERPSYTSIHQSPEDKSFHPLELNVSVRAVHRLSVDHSSQALMEKLNGSDVNEAYTMTAEIQCSLNPAVI